MLYNLELLNKLMPNLYFPINRANAVEIKKHFLENKLLYLDSGINYDYVRNWNRRGSLSVKKYYKLSKILNINLNSKFYRGKNCKRYSYLPNKMTNDLAYVIGILLGDGHLKNDNGNLKGDWTVEAYFDIKTAAKKYQKAFYNTFKLKPKITKDRNYYVANIASKAIHKYLNLICKIPNGAKSHKITVPNIPMNKNNLSCLIQGLFDSDGTCCTKKKSVRYSSVSKDIICQLEKIFRSYYNINTKKNIWIKHKKYKPLYTIIIYRDYLLKFKKNIGFKHPIKKEKLELIAH